MIFFQYYREKANYLERTYDFVERVGMEKIRKETVYAHRAAQARTAEAPAEIQSALARCVAGAQDARSIPRSLSRFNPWKGAVQ